MAVRNFWTIKDNKVAIGSIEFKWEPGISIAQKRRSCAHLHSALNYVYDLYPALDISSASLDPLGVALSAFNLKWRGVSVECWYQGSKVYSIAGTQHHLYKVDSLTAKKSMKKDNNGLLIGFNLEGVEYPMSPRTVFYDYIYLQGLMEFENRDAILDYEVFTDVQATVDIDACQARTVCIYKLLHMQGKLDIIKDFDKFLEWHKEFVEDMYASDICYSNTGIRYLADGSCKILDTFLESVKEPFDVNHKELVYNNGAYNVVDKPKFKNPEVVIYTDMLLDDLCAIELLSYKYKSAVILVANSDDLPSSNYAADNYNIVKANNDVKTWFKDNVVFVKDSLELRDVCEFTPEHRVTVFCLCNAKAIVRDLEYIEPNLKNLAAMIGSSHEFNPNDPEWNANQDLEAYKVLQEFINSNSNCLQVTAGECEDSYNPEDGTYNWLKYSSAYLNKMTQLNENTCCYDLRCILLALSKF